MWLKLVKSTPLGEKVSEAVTSQDVAPMDMPMGARLKYKMKSLKPKKCIECGTWGFQNECPTCGAKTKK